jgi:hypothetical protein
MREEPSCILSKMHRFLWSKKTVSMGSLFLCLGPFIGQIIRKVSMVEFIL